MNEIQKKLPDNWKLSLDIDFLLIRSIINGLNKSNNAKNIKMNLWALVLPELSVIWFEKLTKEVDSDFPENGVFSSSIIVIFSGHNLKHITPIKINTPTKPKANTWFFIWLLKFTKIHFALKLVLKPELKLLDFFKKVKSLTNSTTIPTTALLHCAP